MNSTKEKILNILTNESIAIIKDEKVGGRETDMIHMYNGSANVPIIKEKLAVVNTATLMIEMFSPKTRSNIEAALNQLAKDIFVGIFEPSSYNLKMMNAYTIELRNIYATLNDVCASQVRETNEVFVIGHGIGGPIELAPLTHDNMRAMWHNCVGLTIERNGLVHEIEQFVAKNSDNPPLSPTPIEIVILAEAVVVIGILATIVYKKKVNLYLIIASSLIALVGFTMMVIFSVYTTEAMTTRFYSKLIRDSCDGKKLNENSRNKSPVIASELCFTNEECAAYDWDIGNDTISYSDVTPNPCNKVEESDTIISVRPTFTAGPADTPKPSKPTNGDVYLNFRSGQAFTYVKDNWAKNKHPYYDAKLNVQILVITLEDPPALRVSAKDVFYLVVFNPSRLVLYKTDNDGTIVMKTGIVGPGFMPKDQKQKSVDTSGFKVKVKHPWLLQWGIFLAVIGVSGIIFALISRYA